MTPSRPGVLPGHRQFLALGALTCLLLAGLFLAPLPATAADNGAWSVTPTPPKKATTTPRDYFVLEGDPGTTIRDKVRVQNWTAKPLTFKIYGADGYNTQQDGFFALKALEDEMTDVGGWVDPVTSQVTVYGRTQVDVPFTVTVPKNATPGDHVGAVVARNVAIESSDTGSTGGPDVGVQRAVGARLHLRVSGDLAPSLEVDDVRLEHDRGALPWSGHGHGTVSWTVENTGNVRLSPRTDVTVRSLFGETVTAGAPLGDLLPGQRVRLRRSVTGLPWAGRVTAEVRMRSEASPTEVSASGSTSQWMLPWPALIVPLLLGATVGGWRRQRARRAAARLRVLEDAPRLRVTAGP